MKRTMTLILCAFLILFSVQITSLAEETSCFECDQTDVYDLSKFSESYGLEQFYDDLKEMNGGLFRSWSPKAKAVFYQNIPLLRQAEEDRVHAIDPSYHASLTILTSHSTQIYVSPTEKMISETEAVKLSIAWLEQFLPEVFEYADNYTVCTACIKNGDSDAWIVSYYNKINLIAETFMDAYSGDFTIIDRVAAEKLVIQHAELANAPSAYKLTDLFSGVQYNYPAHTWIITYVQDLDDKELVYLVQDDKLEIIPGSNG